MQIELDIRPLAIGERPSVRLDGQAHSWTISYDSNVRHEHDSEMLLFVWEEFPMAFAGSLADLKSERATTREIFDSFVETCRKANGTFVAALVITKTGEGCIAGDALGVQPLYWHETAKRVQISTTLSGMKRLASPDWDFTGLIESTLLGYCLNQRTVFKSVNRSGPAQVLFFDREGLSASAYLRWQDIQIEIASEAEVVERIRKAFRDAVQQRLSTTQASIAFLSGGLDSRVVVTELIEQGTRPRTFGFSNAMSQDGEFARDYAASAGVEFNLFDRPRVGQVDWGGLLSRAMTTQGIAKRPSWVWSGDGGSVCAGAVYCDEELVSLFEKPAEAVASQLRDRLGLHLPKMLFTSSARRRIADELADDITCAVRDAQTVDGDRASFLFFALHDQRRHLDYYAEQQKEHGLRFLLPFFDRRVLDVFFKCSLAARLRHRLYMSWFRTLPDFAQRTPWQTYPGHEPCWVTSERQLAYQWTRDSDEESNRKVGRLSFRTFSALHSSEISKVRTAIAVLADATSVRRQSVIRDLQSVLMRY